MPTPLERPNPSPDEALASLPLGVDGRVVALEVEPDEGALLRAMGLAEGQSIVVLRTAPGGDPLHVRLGSGGEFALARPLAKSIRVERSS
jgi:Fe2+ transport system protein FeoA